MSSAKHQAARVPPLSLSNRIAWSTAGTMLPQVTGLLASPVISRGLGVTGRGELAAGLAPYLLASLSMGIGLPQAITFVVARHQGLVRRVLRHALLMTALSGLVATLVTVALAPLLSGGTDRIRMLIVFGAIWITPTLLVPVLRAGAQGLNEWRLVAAEQGVAGILRFAAIIALAVTHHLTPASALVATAAPTVLGGLVYLGLRLPHTDGPLAAPIVDPAGYRQLARFGGQVWFGSIASIFLWRLDQVLMVPLSNAHQLGLYAVAVSVSEVPIVFSNSVRDVILPAESKAPILGRPATAVRLSTMACLLFAGAIAACLPWALPLIFGGAFRAAVVPALILLVAVVVNNVATVCGAVLVARSRPALESIAISAALSANVIALLVLVPRYGATGAAAATLIGNVVAATCCLRLLVHIDHLHARRFLGIHKADLERTRRLMGSAGRRLLRI